MRRPNAVLRLAAGLLLAAWAVSRLPAAEETAKKRNTVLVIPIAYYTPETSLAGGVGGILAFRPLQARPDSRPSSVMFSAVYTLKEQFTLQAKPELYFDGESWVVTGNLEWSRYPTQFYGLGNDTPESDGETMSPVQVLAEVQVMKRVLPAWNLYAGFIGVLESYRFEAFQSGGQLASGRYSG